MSGLLIKVKLFGGLVAPEGILADKNGEYPIQLAEGATVANLIELLSLKNKPLIVVINGIICNDYEKKINSGDIISFFPPVAGG